MIHESYMHAMVLERPGELLKVAKVPIPTASDGELLLKVQACGICRTDLHVVDGELTEPALPLIPGHQIVGRVEVAGKGTKGFYPGDLVGVPWLGGTCGVCEYCISGRENLCDQAIFTGYQRNGGFAEYCTADAMFCFSLSEDCPATQIAPLLCAGLIGYRSLRMAGYGKRLGIYGFGAAAHIVTQVAVWEGRQVYAFTRHGDEPGQHFALEMGACWAGGATERPPVELDAAIIFAPAGELVPLALRAVGKGGVVVCGGIHMSPIPSFPYELLWGERTLVSVANLTRQDGEEFLELAMQIPVITSVEVFPLENANEALAALRTGMIKGAGVLVP
ncbi:MAG: zinc-dependent alcohol dehydrogenase family protein [Desulfuromonadaceae bacterium]|nr:zinc-dependent alcohol dehydrogenase family protein [Desulfuromonadaceae bacterium]